MATITSFRRLASLVEMCNSVNEIAQLLQDMSDALYSADVVRILVNQLPRIIRDNETVLCLPFMQEIVDAESRSITDKQRNYGIPHCQGIANTTLLEFYVFQQVAKSGKECVSRRILHPDYNRTFADSHNDWPALIGICFLLIHYDRWHVTDKNLYEGLLEGGDVLLNSFLSSFADISTPMVDSRTSCQMVAKIFRTTEVVTTENINDHRGAITFPDMINSYDAHQILEKLLTMYIDENADETVEDAVNLIMHYQNAMSNDFIRANYISEYAENIVSWLPLRERRLALASRFERYFGIDTIGYMADAYNAFLTNFGNVNSYTSTDVDRAELPVHITYERIIYDMMINHPEVESGVIKLFFREVTALHGHGFRGASDGMTLTTDAIVDGIVKDLNAHGILEKYDVMESYLAQADYYAAMEASFDDLTDSNSSGLSMDDFGGDNETAPDGYSNDSKSLSLHGKPKSTKSWKDRLGQAQNAKKQVDAIVKMIKDATRSSKRAFLCNKKKLTIFGLFRKICTTSIILLSGPMGIICGLITKHILKTASRSETKRWTAELNEELELVEEKIRDAESAGDREAKYALMRTRQAIKNQLNRLRYGSEYGVKEKSSRLNGNIGDYKG